jgi:hypothetical protein
MGRFLGSKRQPGTYSTFYQLVNQWLANLSPFEMYLIAVPAIMLGSILFFGGIILLLEPPRN